MDEEVKKQVKLEASSLVKRYLNNNISLDDFEKLYPLDSTDFRIKYLFHLVVNLDRGAWYSLKSRRIYFRDLEKIHEILVDLKSGRPRFKVMKSLINQLRISSNDFTKPIPNIWYPILETAKITSHPQHIIKRVYLQILFDYNIIILKSTEPLLYEFIGERNRFDTDKSIAQLLDSLPKEKYNI